MQRAGVIEHQVEDHPDPLGMGCGETAMESGEISEVGVNLLEIGDVVTAVLQG